MIKFILAFFFIISNLSLIPLAYCSSSEMVKLIPKIRVTENQDEKEKNKNLTRWQKQFLNIQILCDEELKKLPYVVANNSATLMSVQGSEIYVKNLDNKINNKKKLSIYRISQPIKEKETSEIMAFNLFHIADVKLEKRNLKNNLSLVKVQNTNEEILPGDKLIVNDSEEQPFILRDNHNKKIRGKIVSIINGVSYAEPGQTVVLNLGKKCTIKKGNILSLVEDRQIRQVAKLYENQKMGEKVELPDEKVGSVLIYEVFQHFSLGLVIDSKRQIVLGQKVANIT